MDPSETFSEHLRDIAKEYDNLNYDILNQAMKGINIQTQELFKKVKKYRKGFFCILCDWEQH